jgi:CRISPR-associated protein Csb1
MEQGSITSLTLSDVQSAVTGTAAAFRCVAQYEPAGGNGDKVFPPTYEGGKYATEDRRVSATNGNHEVEFKTIPCVLLDSVQSQANRMEQALLDAWERRRISLPVITVDLSQCDLPKPLKVSSLEAPHRIADALLRDSLLDGKPFRKSETGRRIDHVSVRHATALFELCPTALIFGMWDSTGPRGAAGAKFARAMVSEIVGLNVLGGVRTSSRIDPAQILLGAGPLYRAKEGDITWTLNEKDAARDKKGPVKLRKDGKPSEANHSNVTPTISKPGAGGVTIDKAVQTTVVSLPALRRLRFPLAGETDSREEVDEPARVALATLALCAAALNQEQGCDLRSRCQLHPTTPFVWELLDKPGETPRRFSLSPDQACKLFTDALATAKKAGLPWMEIELMLKPSQQLVDLVRKSQELAASSFEGEEGDN